MNTLPGDPNLPPGVTDKMTEAKSMTPKDRNQCKDCGGAGEFWHGSHFYGCKRCNGTGVEE